MIAWGDVDGSWQVGFQSRRRVFIPGWKLFYFDVLCKLMMAMTVGVYQMFYLCKYKVFYNVADGATHHVMLEDRVDHCREASLHDCKADLRPLSELPYCLVGNTKIGSIGLEKKPCRYLDSASAAVAQGDDVMLDTYVKIMPRHTACFPDKTNNFSCGHLFDEDEVEGEAFYVADTERFNLVIDHTISIPEMGIETNAFENPGLIELSSGSPFTIRYDTRSGIYFDRYGDHLPISEILRSAGINLDTTRSVFNESRRLSGLIFRVYVEYFNTVPWDLFVGDHKIRYRYTFEDVHTPRYEKRTIQYSEHVVGAASRTFVEVRSRGVYFQIFVRGEIGKFSAMALLAWAASVLAGLALWKNVMNYLAQSSWFVGPVRARINNEQLLQKLELPEGDRSGNSALCGSELILCVPTDIESSRDLSRSFQTDP